MPIEFGAKIAQLDEDDFKATVYETMRAVFDVHNELGRLFDEKIYQRELAFRLEHAQAEVPINVIFQDFRKTYHLDLLVDGGALFELKAAASLTDRHRGQLLNYLSLAGLPHGKLVNLRPERVEHEFVNNPLSFEDRKSFTVTDQGWREDETAALKEGMIAVLRDWGTGLDLGLYEEAAAYLCGQMPDAETDVEIRLNGRCLGVQRMRLAAPGVALRITAIAAEYQRDFEAHLCRLLDHTNLHAVQWINVCRSLVQFQTVQKTGK
jgi:GxxExxY protein